MFPSLRRGAAVGSATLRLCSVDLWGWAGSDVPLATAAAGLVVGKTLPLVVGG